jgi:ribosome-associated translation inhibitor RaiA
MTEMISRPLTDLSHSNSLTDLAARIRAEHEAAGAAVKRSVQHAMAAGDLLLEAKVQLKHGQWLPWLKSNCTISERTARLYMTLARARSAVEAEIGSVADLTVRQAVALVTARHSPARRLARAAVDEAEHEWTLAAVEIALQERQERKAIYAAIDLIIDELERLASASPASCQSEETLADLIKSATAKLQADQDSEATKLLRRAHDEAESMLGRARVFGGGAA